MDAVTDLPAGVRFFTLEAGMPRLLDPYPAVVLAAAAGLLGLPCLVSERPGQWRGAVAPWRFTLRVPRWLVLAVGGRHPWDPPPGWEPFAAGLISGSPHHERQDRNRLFIRHCPAGPVEIPGHGHVSAQGYGAICHLVIVARERPAEDPAEDLAAAADAHLRAYRQPQLLEHRAGRDRLVLRVRPELRIEAWSRDDGPSWLGLPRADMTGGIRTWIMEPFQTLASPGPALQPAEATAVADGWDASARSDPWSQLALHWQVRLRDGVLRLRHGVRNLAARPRRLAPWSILVVPRERSGWLMMLRGAGAFDGPFTIRSGEERHGGAVAAEAALCTTGDGVAWRLGGHSFPLCKVGTQAADGWTALVLDGPDGRDAAGRRLALVSRLVDAPAGERPEGGCDLTLYRSHQQGELEHVGALAEVAPGATTWIEQELRLVALPEGDDAPAALLAAVRAAIAGLGA